MRQRRTIRVLALLATLLLTAFGVTSTASTAHASSAHRLATLRAASHAVTHGQAVTAKTTPADHHHDAAQHGLDAVLPPSGQNALLHRGHHQLNTSKPDVWVSAILRSHDGRAPRRSPDDLAPPSVLPRPRHH